MPIKLEKKIASLLMTGFYGEQISSSSHIEKDIQNGLGGIILFDKCISLKKDRNNINSGRQLKELCTDLQNIADSTLLIAVDQEGGMVSRFKEHAGFPTTSTPFELASNTTTKATVGAAKQTATMLKEAGVNFNLAPVVDLNIYKENPIIGIYERSFSESPAIVVEHAKEWISAHRNEGISSCLKHFPGHGCSLADSHEGFVDISETWNEIELKPYKSLINEDFADAIMIGHLFNKRLDNKLPASLSTRTINILRKELNFKKLIITDDMQMGAITKYYSVEKACCQAIAAGVDMVIIGNNMHYDTDILNKFTEEMLRGLDSGLLTEDRINAAYTRVKKITSKHQ